MSLAFPISIEAKKLDGTVAPIQFPLSESQMSEVMEQFGPSPVITRYDKLPLDLPGMFGCDENTPLWQIDDIAHALEETRGAEQIMDNLVECDAPGLPKTPLALANLLMQTSKIPWSYYDVPKDANVTSDEERFGYHIARKMGIYDKLIENNLAEYFDFETFGATHANEVVLGIDGYLDLSLPMPDLTRYDWTEIELEYKCPYAYIAPC
jgi:hypothetical protein